MRLGTKLTIYYIAATLISMILVGTIIINGINYYGVKVTENQFIERAKSAQMYINQQLLLINVSELNHDISVQAANSLSTGSGSVKIYDKNMKLLSFSANGAEILEQQENHETKEILQKSLANNYSYLIKDNYIYFAAPIEFKNEIIGVILFINELKLINEIINAVTMILYTGSAAFIFVIVIVSILIAKRIVKPLDKLVEATEKYSKRDFEKIDVNRSDEIGLLAKSFNSMGEELKDYIQRQEMFVSNVSHELRTPLTAIKGYSMYLVDEVKGISNLEKAVYHLNNESDRLHNLIEELLILSRIDSGNLDIRLININLSDLLESSVSKMQFKAQKCNVQLYTDIEENIFVQADYSKLTQVIINIIDNAIKFSSYKGNVKIKLSSQGNSANLYIIDCGIGIPQDEIKNIFDRFYRGSNSTGIQGTGIGLAISKEIINKLNGKIEISANYPSGTKVLIQLHKEK